MSVSVGELAAATTLAVFGGGGLKWFYDRWRRDMLRAEDRPIKEIATTTQAADAIAKAAASLVEMLQNQLVTTAGQLAEVLKQLTIANEALAVIKEAEAECQRRLDVVESELAALKESHG